jgi:hypothetical protein
VPYPQYLSIQSAVGKLISIFSLHGNNCEGLPPTGNISTDPNQCRLLLFQLYLEFKMRELDQVTKWWHPAQNLAGHQQLLGQHISAVTGLGAGRLRSHGAIPGKLKKSVSSPKCPD